MTEQQLRLFTHEHARGGFLAGGEAILDDLLDRRAQAEKAIDQVLSGLTILNQILPKPSIHDPQNKVLLADRILQEVGGYESDFSSKAGKILKKIDSEFWLVAMESSRLTAVMHAEAKDKFKDQVKINAASFDRKTVFATLTYYLDRRMQTFVEGAIHCFQTLSPEFRSNDAICFRSRIIFKELFAGSSSSFRMYGTGDRKLDDLERVFLLFDGKDPELKESASRKLQKAREEGISEVVLPYFRARMFNRGNVHIYLTNQKLVDRLNELIANHYGRSLGHRTSKR